MKDYEDEAFDEIEKAQQRRIATGVTDGSGWRKRQIARQEPDDIIRMAREATGAHIEDWFNMTVYELERFAQLAVEAEREACALRAEEFLTEPEPDWDGDFWNQAIERVALAIRARGEK